MATPDQTPGVHQPPGVRREAVHGFDAYIVENAHATAAISVFGGQVLSYIPKADNRDVLWLSPLVAQPPTPIRGGIPLCWPYFGREGQTGDVPSHGYARTAQWTLIGGDADADGTTLELEPESLDHLDLRLRLTVRVSTALDVTMVTHNPSDQTITMTEALHNYFHVSDVTDVRVEGLAGLTYLDKFDEQRPHTQYGDWNLPQDVARSDRVYPDAGGVYRLVDPGYQRVITVTGHGARTAVVWNPGHDVASTMADVGPHWREFVCVESANAGPDVVGIPPGSTHSVGQTISVSPG